MLKTKLILGNSISVLKSRVSAENMQRKSEIQHFSGGQPAHQRVKRRKHLHAPAIIGFLKESG